MYYVDQLILLLSKEAQTSPTRWLSNLRMNPPYVIHYLIEITDTINEKR